MKDIVETMMKENAKTKDASAEVEHGVDDSHEETSVDMAQTVHIDPTTGKGEEEPSGTYAGAKEVEPTVLEP